MKTIEQAHSLTDAAIKAGILVPDNPTEYDKDKYPYWHSFVSVQLGRPLKNDKSHYTNAEIIAKLPSDKLRFKDVINKLE